MKLALALGAGLLATFASVGASARGVPPPPMLTPPELKQPIDGYDMSGPYEQWRHWIEARKGPVMDALLAAPAPPPPGEQAFGATQLRFKAHWDLGRFTTGDAQVYCRPKPPYGFDQATCHVVLRRVQIPDDVGGLGGPNALSAWMQANFDAPALARHLRAEGVEPGANWWRVDRARMFAASPSPDAALKAGARLDRVDSRDCPAMAEAFANLDSSSIDLRFDMTGIGDDVVGQAPAPHSNFWTYTLSVRSDKGLTTIETDSWRIGDLVIPILKAAEACAKAAPPQQ